MLVVHDNSHVKLHYIWTTLEPSPKMLKILQNSISV